MIDHLVHLDDVPLENQDKTSGWSISQFRLPITGRDGSASALFHGLFQPGSQHSVHLHDRADELCLYLGGQGLVGAGDDRLKIGPGHARLMPAGVPHFFHNASVGAPAEVFGIYVGATDVEDTGYAYVGKPTEDDLRRCEEGPSAPLRHPVARVAEAAPYDGPDIGWRATDYRPLLATEGRVPAYCFAATVAPGGARARHRIENAETFYLVHEGEGTAGDGTETSSLRAGHVWWVPAGRSSWLRNDHPDRPLVLYGYQVGTAGPAGLGYVHEAEAPARA